MKSIKRIDKYGIARWLTPDGDKHREDGPSIIWPDGDNWWYLRGKRYTHFNDYCNILRSTYGKTDEDIMLLRMQYEIN